MTERVRHSLARPWGGPAELALAVSLYALYELVRGFGSTSLSLARAHTAGFADTVTSAAHVNLSSEALGSLYNPFAAVPSLHFGYALLVGVAVAALAERRVVRILGALYPGLMLFVIVATGNHFLLDAVAGGAVTVAGFWIASRLVPARRSERRRCVFATC